MNTLSIYAQIISHPAIAFLVIYATLSFSTVSNQPYFKSRYDHHLSLSSFLLDLLLVPVFCTSFPHPYILTLPPSHTTVITIFFLQSLHNISTLSLFNQWMPPITPLHTSPLPVLPTLRPLLGVTITSQTHLLRPRSPLFSPFPNHSPIPIRYTKYSSYPPSFTTSQLFKPHSRTKWLLDFSPLYIFLHIYIPPL